MSHCACVICDPLSTIGLCPFVKRGRESQNPNVLAWLAPVNGVTYSLPEWIDDSTLLVVEQGAPGVQGLRVVKMLAVR